MKHVMSQAPGVVTRGVDRVFASQTIVSESEWVSGEFVADSVIVDGPTAVPYKPDGNLTVVGHFMIGFGPDRITAIANEINVGGGGGSHSDGDALDHGTWLQDAIEIIRLQIVSQGQGYSHATGFSFPGSWDWFVDEQISVGAGTVVITDHLVAGTCLVGSPDGMRFGPKEQRMAQRPTS